MQGSYNENMYIFPIFNPESMFFTKFNVNVQFIYYLSKIILCLFMAMFPWILASIGRSMVRTITFFMKVKRIMLKTVKKIFNLDIFVISCCMANFSIV